MAATIVIDAGHGGRDPGAVYFGRREKDDNLRLALAVGQILENNGYTVIYTRTQDVYDTPYEKAMKGNNSGGDFFVSFHRNSIEGDNSASGVETLVYDDSGIKARLARQINENLQEVGFRNLGISVRPNLVVLKNTTIPSVLIETGFINSDSDNELFDSRFNEIAAAIADAITEIVRGEQAVRYYIQTGLYYSPDLAQQQLDQLWALGYPSDMDYFNGYYRLLTGPYSLLEQATAIERQLRDKGFQTLLLQRG